MPSELSKLIADLSACAAVIDQDVSKALNDGLWKVWPEDEVSEVWKEMDMPENVFSLSAVLLKYLLARPS